MGNAAEIHIFQKGIRTVFFVRKVSVEQFTIQKHLYPRAKAKKLQQIPLAWLLHGPLRRHRAVSVHRNPIQIAAEAKYRFYRTAFCLKGPTVPFCQCAVQKKGCLHPVWLRQAEQAEDRCSGSKDQQSGCGPDLSVLRLHDTASFPVCHCNKACSSAQAAKGSFS